MSEARLRWQCRRGMKELDVLLTRYLDDHYAASDDTHKTAFCELLELPDPELIGYLLGADTPTDPDIAHVVSRIRGKAPS